MRLGSLLAFCSLFIVRIASAACPGPACFGGGGPAATDCVVTWSGVTSAATTCVDGSACDQDGAADGVCTFPLSACLGGAPTCDVTAVSSAKVTPAGLAGAGTLQGAIQSLAPGACTAPGFSVAVKRVPGLKPIKPGIAKMKSLVVADGKKDADKLKLTCQPASPSFTNDVQPILAHRCAYSGCHDTTSRSQNLDLSPGAAYASLVGPKATLGGNLPIVAPRSIPRSFMAHLMLGQKVGSAVMMPFGCPGVPPTNGCLTDAEVYTLLAWIQAGAPSN